MSWSGWIATWRLHARSRAHRRRRERAVEIVREAAALGVRWVACVSGGKDSIATLAAIQEAGVTMPAVHAWTEINAPEMDRCAREACGALGFDLDEIEPQDDAGRSIDVIEWLRSLPAEWDILDPATMREVQLRIASGNMLVAYQYARGLNGAVTGMRSEESRGRRLNELTRGPIYQIKIDSHWMCNPLELWTARDVFAVAVERGLPIHPHYQALYERFGVSPESPQSRVDSLLVPDTIATRGALVLARVLYPELWSKLVDARPELRRMA